MRRPNQLHHWLEILVQSSSDGYLLLGRDGRVRFANPAALVIFAASEGELVDSRFDRWVPAFRVDRTDPLFEVEGEGVSAGGDRFPIEYAVIPLDAPQDDALSWVVARDIQRRKGLEGSVRLWAEDLERLFRARSRELEETRVRASAAYDAAPILDFDLDSQGAIASANRKAALTLGVNADRLVGLPLADLALAEHREQLAAAVAKLRGGAMSPFDTKLRGAQGEAVEVTFHPCRTELGGKVHVRLLGLDVSARREAERQVDQSLGLAEAQRARMERILRSIGDAVVVTDPDGQVRLMNETAERLLGERETAAFGRDLFGEQQDTAFVGRWQEFLIGSDDLARDTLHLPGPVPRDCEVTLSRVRTAEGRLAGCVALLRDRGEGRSGDRAQRDVFRGVASEVRTPLASIKSLVTTMLQSDGVRGDDDRRFLGMIERDAARIQKRIEEAVSEPREPRPAPAPRRDDPLVD
ncbi:MAG: PAS domain-containing protein, partial [Candidatus Eiseniibacteriota bacterium]